jgi:hypothetical protein
MRGRSWQSIVNWERNKLDAEQEVAFEVLTATYVLTLTMKQRQFGRSGCS